MSIQFIPDRNAIDQTKRLAMYLKGFAKGAQDEDMEKAAKWLEKLSRYVCAQGVIGCHGGVNCDSDHK